jgi:hypothetical protein
MLLTPATTAGLLQFNSSGSEGLLTETLPSLLPSQQHFYTDLPQRYREGNCTLRSRCSSGSIVSNYGLDDRKIGVRSPAGTKNFSSILCVQTGSGAHPASCPMGTGGPFPGGKARPRRDADHSPHLVPRSRMSRSYSSSLPKCLHGV